MNNRLHFARQVESFQQVLNGYADMDNATIIDTVANRLLGLNYTPPVHLSQDRFLHITSTEVHSEIDRLAKIEGENWDKALQTISIFIYYFKELTELRRGTPAAWDEVDELYVHD